ncbi:aminodeoxychorismate synthase component I [Gracilibacillus sp. YIM 98692]|uniref:aminodeoxychorismate synthase component I n=1 Tax=Gracilibacillus sp. YIM 98692 TaxID=2663532 RepID=UPI0013D50878|nr:aminodeoxychorismate synthase component I [Gracilibacillus sp. YIM 98692]
MAKPFLQFDFDSLTENQPLTFTEPVEVLSTYQISEVKPIFEKIEKAVNDGYYAAGYVAYEAAPAFDPSYAVHDNGSLPLIWFAIFNKPIQQDLYAGESNYSITSWSNTTSYDHYAKTIQQIKNAIESGHTYQVNYTTRLESKFSGNSYPFYQQLLKNQSANYGAYLDIGNHQILSVSPELFFEVNDSTITTKPMKGTMKRGNTLSQDDTYKKQLAESEKDRAENVMIVDLLRNDLGRIAKPGSVQVKKLFEIETYPTVHQMTSTIEAELEDHQTIFNWFEALFPCGSITGAPKVETMKYIAEYETTPREVYCGAIGWISPDKKAVFNVPIRTVLIDHSKRKAIYGSGGGITWDSSSTDEYEELLQKSKVLQEQKPNFSLLESVLLKKGEYPLLSYHLDRLSASAKYFSYSFDEHMIKEKLKAYAKENDQASYKVRLLLNKDGQINISANLVSTDINSIKAEVAKKPIHQDQVYLYHKTTHRSMYQEHDQQLQSESKTSLLWNLHNNVTEFTIGNVVFEKDGKFYTPPVEDGLLPGVYRQKLLNENQIIEKSVSIDEINDYDQIWFINSVRGWLKVKIVD